MSTTRSAQTAACWPRSVDPPGGGPENTIPNLIPRARCAVRRLQVCLILILTSFIFVVVGVHFLWNYRAVSLRLAWWAFVTWFPTVWHRIKKPQIEFDTVRVTLMLYVIASV